MQRPRLARARFQFVVVRWAACIVSAAFVAAGCGGSNQTNRSSSAASSATAASASAGSLLALGDSIASTANPPCQCTAFAALFAHRISARLNDQAISGTQARDLLKQLKSDDFVRQLVGKADDIVIDMGVNDLPWNRSDDPCSVLSPSGVVRWARVDESCIRGVARQFEHTMDAVLNQIDTLRTNKPTILRLTNVYNSVIGDAVDASYDSRAAVKPSEAAVARFDAIQCRLAAEHRGRCVDVDRAFNGPHGAQPAQRFLAPDHLHPNARGQEIIANLLFEAR